VQLQASVSLSLAVGSTLHSRSDYYTLLRKFCRRAVHCHER